MGPVSDAARDLLAALDSVGEGKATADPGATLANLPAFVLGPPRLTWENAASHEPTGALFIVYAVVAADERAVERLWDLVTRASEAIDDRTNGVVIQADPGVFPSGTTNLPCYELQVEIGL
jgi:hypothetical protein